MNIVFMVIFAGIAITVVYKIAHLIYLVFKLGFSLEVIKFILIIGLIATFAVFILERNVSSQTYLGGERYAEH